VKCVQHKIKVNSGWYVNTSVMVCGIMGKQQKSRVRPRPLFLEKERLYLRTCLLMFKKIMSNNPTNDSGVTTTYYGPI